MSDLDTMRWGDTQALTVPGGGVGMTKQLVQGHWQRPLVWKLLFVIIPQVAAGETGTFKAILNLTIGIGQGTGTIPIPITLAPTAGVYAPVIQSLDIPAQDVQVMFSVDATAASVEGAADTFTFSAFIAPFTEPRVLADVRDMIQGGHWAPPREDPDQRGMPHWMPPGFEDGMLRYRR